MLRQEQLLFFFLHVIKYISRLNLPNSECADSGVLFEGRLVLASFSSHLDFVCTGCPYPREGTLEAFAGPVSAMCDVPVVFAPVGKHVCEHHTHTAVDLVTL